MRADLPLAMGPVMAKRSRLEKSTSCTCPSAERKGMKFLRVSFCGLITNWLQVSASTKLSEIDECEGEEFEPEMTNLCGLKAQQQTLEFVLPGKGAFNREA